MRRLSNLYEVGVVEQREVVEEIVTEFACDGCVVLGVGRIKLVELLACVIERGRSHG